MFAEVRQLLTDKAPPPICTGVGRAKAAGIALRCEDDAVLEALAANRQFDIKPSGLFCRERVFFWLSGAHYHVICSQVRASETSPACAMTVPSRMT